MRAASNDKAAFWLESRTNLVKDGDDIVEWRDVRDVDPTATNHYYVWIEEDGEYLMINEIMLSEGYAEPVFIKPNLKYADYFDDYKD